MLNRLLLHTAHAIEPFRDEIVEQTTISHEVRFNPFVVTFTVSTQNPDILCMNALLSSDE